MTNLLNLLNSPLAIFLEALLFCLLPITLLLKYKKLVIFRWLLFTIGMAYSYMLFIHYDFNLTTLGLISPSHQQSITEIVFPTLILAISLILINRKHPQILKQKIPIVPSNISHSLVILSYVLVSVPIQEIIFRGFYLSRTMIVFHNPTISSIVVSIIFGALHLPFGSIPLVLGTIFIGIWYSSIQITYNSIFGPIISHIILGTILLLLTKPPRSQNCNK